MSAIPFLLLLASGSPAANAEGGKRLEVQGLTLGMTRTEAEAALRDYRFFCEPGIDRAYGRYEGIRCRYKEPHFELGFMLSPEDGHLYRATLIDSLAGDSTLEAVDARLDRRYGPPDLAARSKHYRGLYSRRWGDCEAGANCLEATVRLIAPKELTLELRDPGVDTARQEDWFARFVE